MDNEMMMVLQNDFNNEIMSATQSFKLTSNDNFNVALNATQDDKGNTVTTYEVANYEGEKTTIANRNTAVNIASLVATIRMEKGMTTRKYAGYAEIERTQGYKDLGFTDMKSFVKGYLGENTKSVLQYLEVFKTFYKYTDTSGWIVEHPVFDGISLTNLNQIKGTFLKDHSRFITAVMDGELHLNMPLSALKRELKDYNDVDKETASEETASKETASEETASEETASEETASTSTMSPMEKSYYYGELFYNFATEAMTDDKKREKFTKLYKQIIELLG